VLAELMPPRPARLASAVPDNVLRGHEGDKAAKGALMVTFADSPVQFQRAAFSRGFGKAQPPQGSLLVKSATGFVWFRTERFGRPCN
jgi:hypothetical protein